MCLVRDVVLATPHDEHQSADSAAEPPTLVLHSLDYPTKCHAMAENTARHGNSLLHWQYFPALSGRNDDCGTIFAPKNLAVTKIICNFAAVL